MKNLPPVEYLRELFDYNPATGEIHWHIVKGLVVAGALAGCIDNIGYRVIRINGSNFKAHRGVFALYYGRSPTDELDHVNGVRDDNRICNLRECSTSQNNANRTLCNNSAGLKGVSICREGYGARIHYNGKRHWLGRFDTADAVHVAYCAAARTLKGEFARFE